jgi:hypothetical protein
LALSGIPNRLVHKLWPCGNVLRGDELSYQDYFELSRADLRHAPEQIESVLADLKTRVRQPGAP